MSSHHPTAGGSGASSNMASPAAPRDNRSSTQILHDMSNYIGRQITIPAQVATELLNNIRRANITVEKELQESYDDWKLVSTQLQIVNQNMRDLNQGQGDVERTRAELVHRLTLSETKTTDLLSHINKINDDLVAAIKLRTSLEAEVADKNLQAERQDKIIHDLHKQIQRLEKRHTQHKKNADGRVGTVEPGHGMPHGTNPPPAMTMYGMPQGMANNTAMMYGGGMQMTRHGMAMIPQPHKDGEEHDMFGGTVRTNTTYVNSTMPGYGGFPQASSKTYDQLVQRGRQPQNPNPTRPKVEEEKVEFRRPIRPYERMRGRNPSALEHKKSFEQAAGNAAYQAPARFDSWSDSEAEDGGGLPMKKHTKGKKHIQMQAMNMPAQPVPINNAGASFQNQSLALQLFTPSVDIQNDYTAAFAKQYSLIEGWVNIYANEPCEGDVHVVPTYTNPGKGDLWSHLMACSYKNASDAYPHTVALLKDPASRASLVMRMIIQFMVDRVWKLDLFIGHNEKCDEDLRYYQNIMVGPDPLTTAARGEVVKKMAEVIQRLVVHENFELFREERLTELSKSLRHLLQPLLKPGVEKGEAGRGITVFTRNAIDLAIKLFTSNYTFIFIFPECAIKFSQSSMIPKGTEEAPLDLQLRQARVKLVITPMITMRQERQGAISACNIHIANVMVMG